MNRLVNEWVYYIYDASIRIMRACLPACLPACVQVNYTVTSLPTSIAKVYQLSQVFSTYGYLPIAGTPISDEGVVVSGSLNRVYYKRPAIDNGSGGDHKVNTWHSIA